MGESWILYCYLPKAWARLTNNASSTFCGSVTLRKQGLNELCLHCKPHWFLKALLPLSLVMALWRAHKKARTTWLRAPGVASVTWRWSAFLGSPWEPLGGWPCGFVAPVLRLVQFCVPCCSESQRQGVTSWLVFYPFSSPAQTHRV